MDSFSMDASDLDSLAATFAASRARVGALGGAVVRKTAADIEATAKVFAPVDTGFLRNSIGHDITGDGRSRDVEAEIGPTASYGAYVEFGTATHAPAAYMGPALDRHTPAFVTAAAAAAEAALR